MDEIIGTIKLFAGNFAPQSFMYCAGQLLPINQYQALYSVLGTVYGGDGRTTFALPDLRDRVPVGAGMGQGNVGLNLKPGQQGGQATHTLTLNEMPQHNHLAQVSNENSTQSQATNGASVGTPGTSEGRGFDETLGFNSSSPNTQLNPSSVSSAGGSQPHNNMQPYTGLSYIICVNGIYPSRP
ncbi:MAG: tail fiber protein [Flavobacteriaceae bacterium]|nr:tail fiber protein [Flavobacteriaceae bacterium]